MFLNVACLMKNVNIWLHRPRQHCRNGTYETNPVESESTSAEHAARSSVIEATQFLRSEKSEDKVVLL